MIGQAFFVYEDVVFELSNHLLERTFWCADLYVRAEASMTKTKI